MNGWQTALYGLVTVGLVLRLTRFVVVDDLGDWLIKHPLQAWAVKHDAAKYGAVWDDEDTESMPRAVRASHGLSCPFCLSTWLGIGAVGLAFAATLHPATQLAWFIVAAGLTTSYLVGHIIDRLDS